MEIFKVRNSEGLFWEGHARWNFTINGKSWKKAGHVKSAITNASSNILDDRHRTVGKRLPNYLTNCEIVKFELKEVETIKI